MNLPTKYFWYVFDGDGGQHAEQTRAIQAKALSDCQTGLGTPCTTEVIPLSAVRQIHSNQQLPSQHSNNCQNAALSPPIFWLEVTHSFSSYTCNCSHTCEQFKTPQVAYRSGCTRSSNCQLYVQCSAFVIDILPPIAHSRGPDLICGARNFDACMRSQLQVRSTTCQ